MELYNKKRRWKILLLFIALSIGVVSLMYTNNLTQKMAHEERKNVELWGEAIKQLISANTSGANALIMPNTINEQNTTIPVIVVDAEGNIMIDKNISYTPIRKAQVLEKELAKMKKNGEPITIALDEDDFQYLYYRESNLLRSLRFFPIVQLTVVMIFIFIAYLAFSSSRKAEQNQVWVGMSKETAHQLGTPISSLMAWIELLKLKDVDANLISEFEKDTQRLEKITERFSKIGSAPELLVSNVAETILSTINYLKTRSSKRVEFITSIDEQTLILAPINTALFSWVIENLCKNAIDAMDNAGKITIELTEKGETLQLDLTDTGKGIPKSQFKTIFRPGFSTKKRGWGLGLSLAKRIVENYHNGKIFIKQSELKKGTTFRIILRKTIHT